MCRPDGQDRSVNVLTPEQMVNQNLLVYCKPVEIYNVLQARAKSNPLFLPRSLSYRIQANGEPRSAYTGTVRFNYRDCDGMIQKTEVTENCSCPFCYMRCGRFKGLQLHLSSSHVLFEFEVMPEERQILGVSVKVDESSSEEQETHDHKLEPFMFCRKPRKRRDTVKPRRFNIRFLPLDSPDEANDTENGIPQLFNGYRGIGYPEAAGNFEMSGNTAPAIARSSLDSDGKAVLPTEAVPSPTKAKKLSSGRSEAKSNLLLKKRQFYHSHKVQPMSFEEVMSGQDSEDEIDDDFADFEDRQLLEEFVDVSQDEKHFMHLWNSFMRKQNVIADGHILWACEAFSEFHKQEFARCKTLSGFWRIFLVKLWNHGLVDAVTMNNCNLIIEKCENNPDSNNNNSTVVDHQDDNNNNSTVVDHQDDDNNNSTVVDHQDDDNNNNNSTVVDHQDDDNNNSTLVDHQDDDNNNIDHVDVDKDGK